MVLPQLDDSIMALLLLATMLLVGRKARDEHAREGTVWLWALEFPLSLIFLFYLSLAVGLQQLSSDFSPFVFRLVFVFFLLFFLAYLFRPEIDQAVDAWRAKDK